MELNFHLKGNKKMSKGLAEAQNSVYENLVTADYEYKKNLS